MDCALIECQRITDYALALESVKKHWDDISEDGAQVRVPDVINEFWVGVWEDEDYKGCFRIGSITSALYEVHLCLEKGAILEYCKAFFQWCLDNTDLKKMVCNVPEYKTGVLKIAHTMGFLQQGINSDSWMKDGKLHALIQLGITRKQMEGLCQQQFHS